MLASGSPDHEHPARHRNTHEGEDAEQPEVPLQLLLLAQTVHVYAIARVVVPLRGLVVKLRDVVVHAAVLAIVLHLRRSHHVCRVATAAETRMRQKVSRESERHVKPCVLRCRVWWYFTIDEGTR